MNLIWKVKTVLISLESKALGDTISWATICCRIRKINIIVKSYYPHSDNDFFEGLGRI